MMEMMNKTIKLYNPFIFIRTFIGLFFYFYFFADSFLSVCLSISPSHSLFIIVLHISNLNSSAHSCIYASSIWHLMKCFETNPWGISFTFMKFFRRIFFRIFSQSSHLHELDERSSDPLAFWRTIEIATLAFTMTTIFKIVGHYHVNYDFFLFLFCFLCC